MKKPKRIDDKYWTGTREFNHYAYEEDLENYIQDLESNFYLSKKSQKYLDEVIYSLDDGEGKIPTASDALNHILEANADFEESQNINVVGWLAEQSEKSIIRFIDFEDQTPNYGDQILLQYPPESGRDPIITVYDRYTDWIFGCRYAVINEKQK